MILFEDKEKKIEVDDNFDMFVKGVVKFATQITDPIIDEFLAYIIGFLESKDINIKDYSFSYANKLQRPSKVLKTIAINSPVYQPLWAAIDELFQYNLNDVDMEVLCNISNLIEDNFDDITLYGVSFNDINYTYPQVKGAFISIVDESIGIVFWGSLADYFSD